jgi:hypothetical protein
MTDFELELEQTSLAYMDEIPLPEPGAFPGEQVPVAPRVGRGHSLTRRQALESAAAYEAKRGHRNTRKAYKALGDDTTFSRFVKIKGVPNKVLPKQLVMDARHPAFVEGRSIFSRKGVKKPDQLEHLLVSGHSNVKIGNDVRVSTALFHGYRIYTLSLEERATCPRSCENWASCYGNHMPYSKRIDHTDFHLLTSRLRAELTMLMRKPWPGILIRLHALGDFFSVEYVRFWEDMLRHHPRLAIYGYTARRFPDEIAFAVGCTKSEFGRRFAVRWSDGDYDKDCTASILTEADRPEGAFVCPEQTGKVDACGKCGACWTGDRNVAFILH